MPPEGLVEAIVPTHGELMGIAVSVQGTQFSDLKTPHHQTFPTSYSGPYFSQRAPPRWLCMYFLLFFCFLLLSVVLLLF